MAEPRYKIKAIGAPFDTQYSSCSDLKPLEFSWTTEKGDCDVYIDRAIMYQPDLTTSKENRFGWVCESRFITPDVYNFLIHNHKVLFNNYYNKIFTCDLDLISLNSNFIYCPNGSNYPWIKKNIWSVYNKYKLCSMFCSPKVFTEGHIYRHKIARMALDKGFDVYGGAHGTQRLIADQKNPWDNKPPAPWNSKYPGLIAYMFSIVIENGVYDSYYTEKITDCFATGTIPVYYGSKKIINLFDSDGIIFLEPNKEQEILESLSESVYKSKLNSVQNNLNILKTLHTADDFLFKLIKEQIS